MGDKISSAIPEWLQVEVAEYDLPLARHPRTVLDIGANVGAFARHAATLWPDAQIFAFEPIPEVAEELKQNVRGLKVEVQDMAIRGFTGTDVILLGDKSVVNGFHQLGRQTHGTRVVSCLDAKLLPSAEFVKIDTEGCELEIIQRLDLIRTIALCCEYHRLQDIAPIKAACAKAGLNLVSEKATWETGGHLKFARDGALTPDPAPLTPARKVFIALPVYHTVCSPFLERMIRLVNNPGIPMKLRVYSGECPIGRARNVLTGDFLASDCTDLLFIDSDILFTPEDIARICSHDEDVIGGLYCIKQENTRWCVNQLIPDQPTRADGLRPVAYAGTGFLRIRRNVIEQMIAHFGDAIVYSQDDSARVEHEIWPMGIYQYPDGRKRWLSEDWYFCQRWMDLGGKVFVDTQVTVKHFGSIAFPTKAQEADLYTNRDPGAGDSSPRNQEIFATAQADGDRADSDVNRPASHRTASLAPT